MPDSTIIDRFTSKIHVWMAALNLTANGRRQPRWPAGMCSEFTSSMLTTRTFVVWSPNIRHVECQTNANDWSAQNISRHVYQLAEEDVLNCPTCIRHLILEHVVELQSKNIDTQYDRDDVSQSPYAMYAMADWHIAPTPITEY